MKKLTFAFVVMVATFSSLSQSSSFDQYGVSHGVIAAGVVGGVSLATRNPTVLYTTAGLTCVGFAARELRGPGNLFGYPENYSGPYNDADRVLDWVLPCVVGFGVAHWRKESPVVVPSISNDSVTINYMKRF